MKYFIPIEKLGVLLQPQNKLQDKFGGLPWGLPQTYWPLCAQCHNPMLFLAQLQHHEQRLNLGASGRVLHVFQCGEGDETFLHDSGANRCFILEREAMQEGLTPPPDMTLEQINRTASMDYIVDYVDRKGVRVRVDLLPDVRVMSWSEFDDGIAPKDVQKVQADLKDIDVLKSHYKLYYSTKLGSAPAWLQDPELADWQFIGQLDGSYFFDEPLPDPDEVGCPVGIGRSPDNFHYEQPKQHRLGAPFSVEEQRSWHPEKGVVWGWGCRGPNFGDDGIGYIFMKMKANSLPECKFLWQCH